MANETKVVVRRRRLRSLYMVDFALRVQIHPAPPAATAVKAGMV